MADAVIALTAEGLAERLLTGFSPTGAPDFDGTVRLVLQPSDDAPAEAVGFRIEHGRIERLDPGRQTFDITLFFQSADEAFNLLCGSANPVAAFMEGRFRSDGYLLWVFAVLAMFRGR
ncbi:MAG: hypothetical protein FJ194_17540 [Gammaproteobacteria bacterium]|nr:hypothetical protein [Gammaproteobacteria bacterium]